MKYLKTVISSSALKTNFEPAYDITFTTFALRGCAVSFRNMHYTLNSPRKASMYVVHMQYAVCIVRQNWTETVLMQYGRLVVRVERSSAWHFGHSLFLGPSNLGHSLAEYNANWANLAGFLGLVRAPYDRRVRLTQSMACTVLSDCLRATCMCHRCDGGFFPPAMALPYGDRKLGTWPGTRTDEIGPSCVRVVLSTS